MKTKNTKKTTMGVWGVMNLLTALLLIYFTYSYHQNMDVSGPGQQAYSRSTKIEYKIERLTVTEEMLDVVHYRVMPPLAGLLIVSGFTLWKYRKEKDADNDCPKGTRYE
jgi:hypothetical protein